MSIFEYKPKLDGTNGNGYQPNQKDLGYVPSPPNERYDGQYNVNPPPPPMLHSEKKQYVDKIRALQEELELVQTATIMKVNRIIRSVEFLSDEQKDDLILEINRK